MSIARLLPAELAARNLGNARLVHNHLLIDPVEAVLDRSSPAYLPTRKAVRQAILAATAENLKTTFIFTDFQSNNERGDAVLQDYQSAAQLQGRPLILFVLHCEVVENVRRGSSRSSNGTTKLTDRLVLEELNRQADLWRTPSSVHIDVTCLTAIDAARQIADQMSAIISGFTDSQSFK